MTEPFIGEIRMFAGDFAPVGWECCDGQLLPLSDSANQPLFSLLGTTWGGDGRTTFGLPDLRGRVPMHEGSGPSLTPRTRGETGGTETNSLNLGTQNRGTGMGARPTESLESITGADTVLDNMQPFAVVKFIIAKQGVFPSRPS